MFKAMTGADVRLAGFFQIPDELILGARYRGLSAAAKILYGLCLRRLRFSVKNGWEDETGVFFLLKESKAAELLGVKLRTVQGYFKELRDAELIDWKKNPMMGWPVMRYLALPVVDGEMVDDSPQGNEATMEDPYEAGYGDIPFGDIPACPTGQNLQVRHAGQSTCKGLQSQRARACGIDTQDSACSTLIRERSNYRENELESRAQARAPRPPEGGDTPGTPKKGEKVRPSAMEPVNAEQAPAAEREEAHVSGKRFTPPSVQEVKEYARAHGGTDEMAEAFFNYWESVGWARGRSRIKNWHAAFATWRGNEKKWAAERNQRSGRNATPEEIDEIFGRLKDYQPSPEEKLAATAARIGLTADEFLERAARSRQGAAIWSPEQHAAAMRRASGIAEQDAGPMDDAPDIVQVVARMREGKA